MKKAIKYFYEQDCNELSCLHFSEIALQIAFMEGKDSIMELATMVPKNKELGKIIRQLYNDSKLTELGIIK